MGPKSLFGYQGVFEVVVNGVQKFARNTIEAQKNVQE